MIFFEPKKLYRASVGEVSEEYYEIPLGKAEVLQQGKDVTVLAWGAQMEIIQKAVDMAQAEGISCEVIDLRSIQPWDVDTVAEIGDENRPFSH